jgi:hypothetical protein
MMLIALWFVIPGRREAANPDSITLGLWLWMPAFGVPPWPE